MGPLLQGHPFLPDQSESCVCILSILYSNILIGCWTLSRLALSLILFVIFIDMILILSQDEVLQKAHLLFADDMLLLTSSIHNFQPALGWSTAMCEGAWIKVSNSKSTPMVLCLKTVNLLPSGWR